MSLDRDTEFERIAKANGVAIAVASGPVEVSSINNNSICRTINPEGGYVEKCRAFCGTATEEADLVGGPVSFTCHAGLECRAVPIAPKTVAIVGRAFVKADDYRRATERAMTGDWKDLSPAALFENVLLTASAEVVDKAARSVIALSPKLGAKVEDEPSPSSAPPADPVPERDSSTTPVEEIDVEDEEKSGPGSSAWRSFFSSILRSDLVSARRSMLEFVAKHYDLQGLIWLERVGHSLEGVETFGSIAGKKVRLGIAADDRRLTEAADSGSPLELGEKNGGSSRTMRLFPIGVGGEITSALATLDDVSDEAKHQIARTCLSVAPQMEILRLRNEVSRNEQLSALNQTIGEAIRDVDAEDFWLRLTQGTAEILEAERASLLLYDDRTEGFVIKALIGSRSTFDPDIEAGQRVARHVRARGTAALITDVSRTGLPPAPDDRNYRTPSFLSCPVAIGERVVGVISFTDRANGKPFDRASLETYDTIAPQLAVAIDRARLKERAGEFEALSVTDALTGLLNRRYIEQRLNEEVKRSNRHGFPMSFMMLDVDHFKSYNDEFGHPAGDEALKLVGSVIRETLRAADVAARFGGEEFAILLPQTMPDEAAVIAERIRVNIESTEFPHRDVTMSIGVASCSADLCSSENIVSAADKALYEAKRGGRNRVKTFEAMGTVNA